jgi:hypothetical protein
MSEQEIKDIKMKDCVMRCGLSVVEYTERERLLELQQSTTRVLSKQEFDRLKELSNKMFVNAGSPHEKQVS